MTSKLKLGLVKSDQSSMSIELNEIESSTQYVRI